MRFRPAAMIIICVSPLVASAGSITGITKQLDNILVPNVQIQIINLNNNETVTTAQSGSNGQFTVNLPDNTPVSVNFTETNHDPASLVGILGSVTLSDFQIFMPGLKGKPQNKCCDCYRRGLFHRR